MILHLERRPRTATAIQLTADNVEECLKFIHSKQAQAHGTGIMLRHNGTHIETLTVGKWALRGMDGKIRVMTDEEIWRKYQVKL